MMGLCSCQTLNTHNLGTYYVHSSEAEENVTTHLFVLSRWSLLPRFCLVLALLQKPLVSRSWLSAARAFQRVL